ncbi:hypothetical protein ONZ51_g11935 [Trametes cubensis]|uniref:Uncharacterized protein n=1 Tax=Trametes cubensis TaxID=1111947 RepID=A0AAD7X5D6_9APHY|nr:hypothetical protein ONZ51_g11935 [Trametes cubensis]
MPGSLPVMLWNCNFSSEVMQTHANKGSASSPTQALIAKCNDTLSSLAPSAKHLHRAFRDVSRQVARIDDPRRDVLKSEWSASTKQYKGVIDESDVFAGKLAALIKVYLALQGNVQEGQECLVELNGYNYDFGASCTTLKGNVEVFYLKLVDPTGNRRENERALQAEMFSRAQSESPPQETRQPEAAISSVAYVSQFLWRMWDLLIERLPTLYATTTAQTALDVENRNTLAPAQTTALNSLAQAGTSDVHVRQRGGGNPEFTHSHTATPLTSDKPVHDIVATSIKEIMLSLGRQASQFDVFRGLTFHLKNEINSYLQALQSANAIPTAEKRAALANTHARIALSATHWRACASALTDGYSRIQK